MGMQQAQQQQMQAQQPQDPNAQGAMGQMANPEQGFPSAPAGQGFNGAIGGTPPMMAESRNDATGSAIMDWIASLIEMAETETRWMEIMESQNGKKGQGQLTPSSPATNEAGYGDSAETEADSGGGYTSIANQNNILLKTFWVQTPV